MRMAEADTEHNRGNCKDHNDEALTLNYLSRRSGYSEFHVSRKFKEISGMQFRDYLRYRRLAFKNSGECCKVFKYI